VLGAIGDGLRAAHIAGAAERLREQIGSPLTTDERLRHERRMAAVRVALGEDDAFERAWQKGRAMSSEQAIEISLQAEFGRG
jgi:hypothetical protein